MSGRRWIANAIDTKLEDALAALSQAKQGDQSSTCGKLGGVANQIQSQAVVKQITQAQADMLSAKVSQRPFRRGRERCGSTASAVRGDIQPERSRPRGALDGDSGRTIQPDRTEEPCA